jgi:hypothetical protein
LPAYLTIGRQFIPKAQGYHPDDDRALRRAHFLKAES